MLFNSLHFLLFFPVVTALYFLLPHRTRWALLLAASCYFYMVFKPVYILILIFTIVVDYFAAIWIEEAALNRRKPYLILSILANIGILGVFKYYNFFNDSVHSIASVFNWTYPIPALSIILPIGLSFHVFQSLSYTIEVYRGNQTAERHFGIYSLYVMFYPQLVAGPIERPQNLLHQFRERHYFENDRVSAGLRQMLWGMFKKVVIADRLSIFVNQVYNNPHSYSGPPVVLATVFFAIQIYCDFSGYSDIAIGSAKVMGFKLMTNFHHPYFSQSIAEFWKRWHISLSTWFRDYVYIPLGGNRVSRARWFVNLSATFLVSGLWHGANWTYVIWGGLNGLYLVAEILAADLRKASHTAALPGPHYAIKAVRMIRTFILACFAWIFFRANTTGDAFYIAGSLFRGWSNPAPVYNPGQRFDFAMAIGGIVVLLIADAIAERGRVVSILHERRFRWGLSYATAAAVLFLGAFNSSQQFIYFQF